MPADPSVYQLPHATIRRVAVTSMDNNVYLITSHETGSQLLIDAAGDVAAINGLLDQATADAGDTRLEMIVTTHSHHDHIGALADLVASTGALTAAGRDDAAAISEATGVTPDRLLDNGDALSVGGLVFQVIGLRGHTPGSIALAYAHQGPTHLFTGDSLFPGGVGNTNKDPERFASLFADVTTRIFDVYDDATIVHPGHGAATTLGAERPHLGEWQQRGW